MKAYLDYEGLWIPVVVWHNVLHIRKKFHLSIVGIEVTPPLSEDDTSVITVLVQPAHCLRRRHFHTLERKAYKKMMRRYGWDITFRAC